MAGRSRRRRRVLFLVLLGGVAWYARSRLAAVREPWSSAPGEPVVPGDPEPPSPSAVSAAWAEAEPPAATPQPEPAAEIQSLFEPPTAGVPALYDGAAPGPEYTIKGNADSMLFHSPTSPYYRRTKAEVWFRDPDEARAAGFTEWTPKKRAARSELAGGTSQGA